MVKEINLTQSKVAIVDDRDYDFLVQFKWSAFKQHDCWYAAANIKQDNGKWKLVKMHRLITDAPNGIMVDHHNRNGLDNRRENLRCATNSQNQANRLRKVGVRSKYKGLCVSGDRWRAQVRRNGKTSHVGCFDSEEDAARAYDAAAIAIYGNYAP